MNRAQRPEGGWKANRKREQAESHHTSAYGNVPKWWKKTVAKSRYHASIMYIHRLCSYSANQSSYGAMDIAGARAQLPWRDLRDQGIWLAAANVD